MGNVTKRQRSDNGTVKVRKREREKTKRSTLFDSPNASIYPKIFRQSS